MSATKSELWTQLSKAVKILDEIFKFAGQNATNFIGLADSLQQAYEGSHVQSTNTALTAIRTNLNSLCSTSDLLSVLLRELARVGYSSTASTTAAAIDDIIAGMYAGGETVKNRVMSYGALFSPAINVGDGILYRLTVDKYGFIIEAGAYNAGVVRGDVFVDKNVGTIAGNEQLKLRGEGIVPTDNIEMGTAPAGEVILTAKRASDGLLTNANFSSADSTDGVNLLLSGWSAASTVLTHLNEDTSNFFRKIAGETFGRTVKFLQNNSLVQYVAGLSTSLPYLLVVRFYRYSNCDGTLTISLGSKSISIADLTTQATATWIDLVLGDADEKGWYEQFKEDDGGNGVKIKIELSNWTTGALGIAEIVLVPMVPYDGKYYVLTAGRTDFLKGDYFTYTDTATNTGRIQTTIARLFGKSLPHTAGTPTYADA